MRSKQEIAHVSRPHIPERFSQTLRRHLQRQNSADIIGRVPLILGIQGPPGSGKSFQTMESLQQLGTTPLEIPAGSLESAEAGESARLLRQTYQSLGLKNKQAGWTKHVLVLDDLDVGLGHWGGLTQYTVNTQLVIAELMHFADHPNRVIVSEPAGGQVLSSVGVGRVPIIALGNDFAKLHGPLLRTGRMQLFEWVPRLDDVHRIVARVFPEFTPHEIKGLISDVERLLGNKRTSPPIASVSIYQQIRVALWDDVLDTLDGVQDVRSMLPSIAITFKSARAAAERVCDSTKIRNHLGVR